MKKQLDLLRNEIAPLNAQRAILEQYPLSVAETLAEIKSELAAVESSATNHLARKMSARARGERVNLLTLSHDGSHRLSESGGREVHESFASLLVAAAGTDTLLKLCAKALATLPLEPTKAARDKRLADVRAQLDVLELQEERLISESELDGNFTLTRRVDCRPEIVLAVQP